MAPAPPVALDSELMADENCAVNVRNNGATCLCRVNRVEDFASTNHHLQFAADGSGLFARALSPTTLTHSHTQPPSLVPTLSLAPTSTPFEPCAPIRPWAGDEQRPVFWPPLW